jgi:isoleucyl-tRNA synthetase
VTASLEAFDSAAAGRRLAALIDDLSNWYVRRSRRRFWAGPSNAHGASAFATLHSALVTVTKLMAPITPFLTDYLWGVLREPGSPESVHLAQWPAADASLIDPGLATQMALARRVVDLGRSARCAAGVGIRQPLERALVGASGFASLPAELRSLVAEELNVHSVSALDSSADGGELVRYSVKPDFRALGKRFGARTQAVAAAIRDADPAAVAAQIAGGSLRLDVAGAGPVEITAADVIVTQTPAEGWGVAVADGETVALDLAVSPSLRAEGLAREVVRRIQEARKASGLAVTDRISLHWSTAGGELADALAAHGALIADEVLAETFEPGEPPAEEPGNADKAADGGATGDADAPGGWHEHVDADLGLHFWLAPTPRLAAPISLSGPALAWQRHDSLPGNRNSW